MLAVQNLTGEAISVSAQTLLANGTFRPSAGDFEIYVIPPDSKTRLLALSGKTPIQGVSARIWAKGLASGRIWAKNRIDQVWLVSEFDGNEGRHYYAPSRRRSSTGSIAPRQARPPPRADR